jgi:hypothetical protein
LFVRIFTRIPVQERPRIAQFLDTQGLKELALQISTDPDHRFDLAIQVAEHFFISLSLSFSFFLSFFLFSFSFGQFQQLNLSMVSLVVRKIGLGL